MPKDDQSADRGASKLAYLIAIHQYPDLFRRLFTQIHDPRDYYLVHVDRKSRPALHQAVAEFLHPYPNAEQVESQRVVWGGWSQVELYLRAIRRLLETADDWTHFINLSGQDFPLQSPGRIRTFLGQTPDRNYIQVCQPELEFPPALNRVRHYWIKIPGLPVRRPVRIPLIKRRFLKGVRPWHGSNWFILSRPFCQWLTTSPEVKRFERFYRHVVCPDEGFVQTVIMHSPFRDTVVSDNQRAIVWTGQSSPKTFTHADLGFLLTSGKLFARKFDPAVDQQILDDLEAHLRRPAGL
jgi:hypothetical protein